MDGHCCPVSQDVYSVVAEKTQCEQEDMDADEADMLYMPHMITIMNGSNFTKLCHATYVSCVVACI